MKNLYLKTFLVTAILTLSAFSVILIQSCKKDVCKGVVCLFSGTCVNGVCHCISGMHGVHCESQNVTKIILKNNAFTELNLLVGTKIILQHGDSAIFTGTFSSPSFVADAFTIGPEYKGNRLVGEVVRQSYSSLFPRENDSVFTFDIPKNYFLLRIKNESASHIGYVSANRGMTSELNDLVDVPNDSTIHNVGYYKASDSSNLAISSENGSSWNFPTLSLPDTLNQTITLIIK